MKALIMGDVYSTFIENFSKSLKKYDSSIELSAINIRAEKFTKNEFENVYENLYHISLLSNAVIEKIPKIRGVIRKFKERKTIAEINKSLDEFDVILLHGFWETSLKLFDKQLNLNKQFLIGAFWGSDFYKRSTDEFLKKAIKKCDAIIISTKKMQSDIQNVFSIENKKIHNCLFGLATLDELYKLKNISQSESKNILRLPEKSFIITCGYNANSHQQHIAIINQLKAVQSFLPQDTILVFPLTYGGQKDYINQIKKAATDLNIQAKFLENFLDDITIAHLRKATDVFIQIQTTDANSGSMQEHLFAQNVVITGSWLPYQKYRDDNIYFETIDNIEELGSKIKEVVNNFVELKNKAIAQNAPDKFKQSLWSEAIKDWYNVLSLYKTKQIENSV